MLILSYLFAVNERAELCIPAVNALV